jgi:hypothetical protein
MKRMFIFVGVVLLLAGSLYADEAILIDFSKLAVDISVNNQEGEPDQNQQTLMDFGNTRYAASVTPAQRDLLKSSLAPANWTVTLSSSSRTVTNQVSSYAKEARSTDFTSVLGVRVHFPVEPHNAWALIKPPFDIPAYELTTVDADGNITPIEGARATSPSRFEAPTNDEGKVDSTQPAYGVVKNVGTIKAIAVNVYGLNFPHSLSAILIDGDGNEKTIFLGYLNFDGWGELIWNNPAYVSEVRNRELRLYPLYPIATPFVKFGGFLVQRDAASEGGDFIAYFKDVKIIYDKAVLDDTKDIDNEDEWSIINTRETDKLNFEMERFGQNQILQYLEQQRKATENTFTPTPTN